MSMIVTLPPVSTLATDEPEMIPFRPEESTEALAGPPRRCPISANATRVIQLPAPAWSSIAPKST